MVDCRKGSPTYGKHIGVELDDEDGVSYSCRKIRSRLCTLKASAPSAPKLDSSTSWNDPDLRIDRPVAAQEAVIWDKDKQFRGIMAQTPQEHL